jgi:hypothetical protein
MEGTYVSEDKAILSFEWDNAIGRVDFFSTCVNPDDPDDLIHRGTAGLIASWTLELLQRHDGTLLPMARRFIVQGWRCCWPDQMIAIAREAVLIGQSLLAEEVYERRHWVRPTIGGYWVLRFHKCRIHHRRVELPVLQQFANLARHEFRNVVGPKSRGLWATTDREKFEQLFFAYVTRRAGWREQLLDSLAVSAHTVNPQEELNRQIKGLREFFRIVRAQADDD